MIPVVNDVLSREFQVMEQPSNTFFLDIEHDRVYGFTDGQKAMVQAIYLILNTERYRHMIFSRNYGIELQGLYGQPMTYVVPELERRITEALLHDTRITSLENFGFETEKNKVKVTFVAVTIFGEVPVGWEVSV